MNVNSFQRNFSISIPVKTCMHARKMAGKRYSKNEIRQVRALIDEGRNNREIATKLGRSEAGIRNACMLIIDGVKYKLWN